MIVLSDLSDDLLQRKLTLCNEVLETYDILDPGRNNQRTNVIFELNSARVVEAKRKLGKKLASKEETQVRLYYELSPFRFISESTKTAFESK